MKGVVRPARMRDLDRIAAMWTAITRHHEQLDPLFRMRPDADGELRELLSGMLRDVDVELLVYDVDGDLPGMCIVRVDCAPPILEETERAEITDLSVREDSRRSGIGSTLVAEAVRWAKDRGIARLEVQVAHGNREGQGFWRNLGFADLMDVLHRRI